jgi:hypothetical protein
MRHIWPIGQQKLRNGAFGVHQDIGEAEPVAHMLLAVDCGPSTPRRVRDSRMRRSKPSMANWNDARPITRDGASRSLCASRQRPSRKTPPRRLNKPSVVCAIRSLAPERRAPVLGNYGPPGVSRGSCAARADRAAGRAVLAPVVALPGGAWHDGTPVSEMRLASPADAWPIAASP